MRLSSASRVTGAGNAAGMRQKHKPLDQQVIVVFGASSGIGRATALVAAKRGAKVVAAARDEAALTSLVAEAMPAEVAIGTADAAQYHDVAAIAQLALAHFGRIDTWAHVAGIGEFAPVERMTPEEFRRIVEVDLLGPVHGAMAALPHLRKDGGAFVVVSSETARRSLPLLTAYSAAKHGVDGFVEGLRVELEHDRAPVSVTQIMPGSINTPFFENARSRLGVRGSGPPPVYSPEKVAEAILDTAVHPRRDVVVGGAAKLQLALQKVSPRLVDLVAKRSAVLRQERSDEPKHVGDDALFDAPHGDDRVRAGVTTMRR
jgi:NAD(P)-dependent dehydrogenase (short-subunit alcohol dehydrogenase family)